MKLKRILLAFLCGVGMSILTPGVNGAPPRETLRVTDAYEALTASEHVSEFAIPRWSKPVTDECSVKRVAEHYVPRLLVNNISRNNFGIFAFEPVSGADIPEWEIINQGGVDGSAQLRANFGGVFKDNRFHCIGGTDYGETMFIMHYTEWDSSTWECLRNERIQNRAFMATDLTVDPTTDRIYGYFSDEEGVGQEFGYIDFDKLLRHTICTEEGDKMVAVAADAAGQLYAISLSGNLYRISKDNGEKTLVGNTDVALEDMNMTAAFDYATGILYWIAACTDGSCLYTVDLKTGKASLVQPLGQELYSALEIEKSSIAADAPAGVHDFSADFNNPTYTGDISFTLPTTTYMGQPLSGVLSYVVKVGDTILMQGSGTVGETVKEKVTLSPGMNTILIMVKGATGNGPETSHEVWAGPDEPCKVENLQVVANSQGIDISWNAPSRGRHSGYIEPSALTYNVKRLPDETLVAEGITSTSFSDKIEHEGMKSYRYVVTAYNGSLKGEDTESDICVAGHAFEIPYYEDFLTQESFNTFTAVDADADGVCWQWVDNDARPFGGERETFAAIYINAGDMDHISDDYLISPAVSLRSGEKYELKFNAAGFSGADDLFDVLIGRGDGYDNYKLLIDSSHLNDNAFKEFKHTIEITESGDYRIAFRFKSSGNNNGFMMKLRDVGIDMQQNESLSPEMIGDFKAEADKDGFFNVNLSFTAPTSTTGGDPIESIEQIVIVRTTDNVRVKTFVAPKPGEKLQYMDTEVPAGWNTYTVTCYSSGTKGKESSATVYVGEDIPLVPSEVKLCDNLDGTATLMWKSPGDKGVAGLLVNESRLTYNIYYSTGELYEEGLNETSIVFSDVPQDGIQKLSKLLVSAVSSKGEGAKNASTTMITGKPYQLPYYESFPLKVPMHDLYWQEGNGEIMFQLTDAMSVDADDGSIFWTSASEELYQTFLFGKMDVRNCKRPVLSFSYYAVPDFDIMLDVGCVLHDGRIVNLKTIDYKELLGKKGWRKAVVDLSELKNEAYFIPFVKGYGEGAMSHSVILDDFRFIDSNDNDLSVILDRKQYEALAGDKVTVKCVLRNSGSLNMKDCNVKISDKSGNPIAVDTVSVPSYSDVRGSLNFVADPFNIGERELCLVVDGIEDPKKDDNQVSFNLKVSGEYLPEPASLSAELTQNGVGLSWEAPAGDGVYTEDFERYPSWTTSNIGKWSSYDIDGGRNYGFGTLNNIPNQYGYTSFTVFSPEAAEIDLNSNPAFVPVSGSRYLFNWSSEISTMSQGYSDDWLISPELSGDRQTISFWLSSFWDYCPGEAEVWYSTKSCAREDFIRLCRITPEGAGFTYHECDLPEGTRYFAIELLAGDKGAMGLDDISFKPSFRKVTGYALYRDRIMLAKVGADKKHYTDTSASGNHTYTVAALYEYGESTGNPVIDVKTSSVTQNLKPDFRVKAGHKQLTIYNPEGLEVSIHSIQGLTVVQSRRSEFTVNVESGVYLVKGNGRIIEVMVK